MIYDFEAINQFLNTILLFLENKVATYQLPDLFNNYERYEQIDRNLAIKLTKFVNKFELIRGMKEDISFFSGDIPFGKGESYKADFLIEINQSIKWICDNIVLPNYKKNTLVKNNEKFFLESLDEIVNNYQNNETNFVEMNNLVKKQINYWQEELSFETKIVTQYFILLFDIISILKFNQNEIDKQVIKFKNFIKSS